MFVLWLYPVARCYPSHGSILVITGAQLHEDAIVFPVFVIAVVAVVVVAFRIADEVAGSRLAIVNTEIP